MFMNIRGRWLMFMNVVCTKKLVVELLARSDIHEHHFRQVAGLIFVNITSASSTATSPAHDYIGVTQYLQPPG